jgi:hypothetical protein
MVINTMSKLYHAFYRQFNKKLIQDFALHYQICYIVSTHCIKMPLFYIAFTTYIQTNKESI